MRRRITILILALGLLFCIGFANAERLEESQGKEVKLSRAEWKKLNVFFSNFSEACVEPFFEDEVSNDELINFGVNHNFKNNEILFENASDFRIPRKE